MCFMLFILFITAVNAITFHISNNTPKILWIGIIGERNNPHLENGGFILLPYNKRSVLSPTKWSGKFWARTHCDPKSKICLTGSCGRKIGCSGMGPKPPITLVEIQSIENNTQIYGVSLIDGFNIEVKIAPSLAKGGCSSSQCLIDLNANCHEELSEFGPDGAIIGCHSACNKYYSSCCRQADKIPYSCAQSIWPVNSLEYFKFNCPDVANYIFKETYKTFKCSSQEYLISFGAKF